jgi:uncharacterized OB-fold protein
MADQEPTTNRPAPIPDAASQPFFDAAAQGRLLIKHCPSCARYLAPAAEACDACHSRTLEWREASGRGTLYSFVIQHQVLHPGFAGEVPYNVIVVELEEGPRLTSNYAGDNADLRVDMALQVVFERIGEVSVPKWIAGEFTALPDPE